MMARRQVFFWLAGLIAAVIAVVLFRSILLPFIAGLLVAYFLDPVVDRVEAWGLGRTFATSLITALFFALSAAVLVALFPLLRDQFTGLIERLPELVRRLEETIGPALGAVFHDVTGAELDSVQVTAKGFAGTAVAWFGKVVGGIWSGGLALFNLVSLVFITPVIAFYLLRDWDHLVARVDGWLPRHHAATVREQLGLMDSALAGFLRGQATVCLVLGVFYATGLTLVGLDFGIVIGLIGGVLAFIPYVGTILTLAISAGFAFMQFWPDPLPIVLVAVIFLIGQLAEGMFLTPKLVGGRVGLHPVWVIFALLAGGALLGFLGVLIAVPVAAIVGVLARFALGRYLDGPFYHGGSR
jgi:predicted PurR-regulated permease PerM